MTEAQISNLIEREFREKTFGVTEQYLEIHEPVYDENGTLVIARIDRETEGQTIVYLPVKDEFFFFAVYLDEAKEQFCGIGTEARNHVYFRATSESLSFAELSGMISLEGKEGWDKGTSRKPGGVVTKFSSLKICPNPEPDEFEDKLEKLLTCLEQDKAGLLKLVALAECYVGVAMHFHYGNGMIGGPILDQRSIRRLAELQLPISFDLYVGGRSIS